ncbi:MAG: hypothetical protein C0P79_009610 [Gammaproteobacteria bacterium]|nr:hypothetical protein [Gammaproteobacteria bacterium]
MGRKETAADLPDFLADPHLATGALLEMLPEHAPPDVAIYVVRPGGRAPRKVAVLTELIAGRLGKRCAGLRIVFASNTGRARAGARRFASPHFATISAFRRHIGRPE